MMMNNEDGVSKKFSEKDIALLNHSFDVAIKAFLEDTMLLAESASLVSEIYKKYENVLDLRGREETAKVVAACADSLLTHLDELRKKYDKK